MVSTLSPEEMFTSLMVPLFSALIVVSIFIASMTRSLSPLITLLPASTKTFATCPGKGDPTWSLLLSSAFALWTIFLENSLFSMSIVRGCPFISKNTEHWPVLFI